MDLRPTRLPLMATLILALSLAACAKKQEEAAIPAIPPTELAAIDTPPPAYPAEAECDSDGGTRAGNGRGSDSSEGQDRHVLDPGDVHGHGVADDRNGAAEGSRREVVLRSSLCGCGVEGRGVGGAQPGFVKALCSGSSGGCSYGIGVATRSDHSTSVEHESSDEQQRSGHGDDEHRHGASLPTNRERSNAAPGHRVPR